MTDGVTDDIIWIQGTRMPLFNTRLGLEKRKTSISSLKTRGAAAPRINSNYLAVSLAFNIYIRNTND